MSTPDQAGNGFLRLHEAYRASRADYTGKVTVPVLWGGASRRIVNNESLEIAHTLNEAFNALGGNEGLDRYPSASRPETDALSTGITRSLAEGVYTVAAGRNQVEFWIRASEPISRQACANVPSDQTISVRARVSALIALTAFAAMADPRWITECDADTRLFVVHCCKCANFEKNRSTSVAARSGHS
jgi:hypothetical protein